MNGIKDFPANGITIAIAADHGGFALKQTLSAAVSGMG